jgi:hypothetical protein
MKTRILLVLFLLMFNNIYCQSKLPLFEIVDNRNDRFELTDLIVLNERYRFYELLNSGLVCESEKLPNVDLIIPINNIYSLTKLDSTYEIKYTFLNNFKTFKGNVFSKQLKGKFKNFEVFIDIQNLQSLQSLQINHPNETNNFNEVFRFMLITNSSDTLFIKDLYTSSHRDYVSSNSNILSFWDSYYSREVSFDKIKKLTITSQNLIIQTNLQTEIIGIINNTKNKFVGFYGTSEMGRFFINYKDVNSIETITPNTN